MKRPVPSSEKQFSLTTTKILIGRIDQWGLIRNEGVGLAIIVIIFLLISVLSSEIILGVNEIFKKVL